MNTSLHGLTLEDQRIIDAPEGDAHALDSMIAGDMRDAERLEEIEALCESEWRVNGHKVTLCELLMFFEPEAFTADELRAANIEPL